MNVLSLYDGISCGMAALDRAEIHVESYSAYEIDKYAITFSAKNNPMIEHHGNVFEEISKSTKAVICLLAALPAPTGA